jgi:diguanylate cyclase (GGDEF)-like protein
VSADQIVLLAIGLILIAAVAVTVAWATASAARREPHADAGATGLRDRDDAVADLPRAGAPRGSRTFVAPTSTRQVARVVALLFLASAAVIVAITGAWPVTEPAVFTLLAGGTLLVVLFMDLVPPAALGRWRRPAEAIGAVVFLTILTALTGAASSPFFVGFFLVVAGTALSTEGRAPLAIALLSAASVALVGVMDAVDGTLQPEGLAWVGFTAVALILMADIATAAARAQRHARDEALRASRFDSLTGLYNRAFFFTTMEQEIRRSDRMGRDFTMLMLDLDDLKPVNDTFGHQWGDRLLKAVADTIRHTVRFTDAAARYGGDEFVILLPETDAAGGYVVAEKLRRDIAALTLRAADRNVRSSVSVGLVTYPHDGATIEQLVSAADVAMYESKRRGKNRIVGYQTRTERIATAIDSESAEVVRVEPLTDARTGGDPVPWETEAERRSAPSRATLTELSPSSGRTAAAIPVEPDAQARRAVPIDSGQAAATGGRTARSDAAAQGPTPGPGQATTDAARPSTSGGTGPSTPGGAASPGAGRPDQPWLTRTEPTPPAVGPAEPPRTPGPGPSSEQPGPGDTSEQRPAADQRRGSSEAPGRDPSGGGAPGRGGTGRSSSRSEEIRGTRERPWIALPIEPWEPPERPKG